MSSICLRNLNNQHDDFGDFSGQSLLSVAVHEIGHSLGLQHSNVKGSVMWPWKTESSAAGFQTKLAYDDILAIQSLYGGKSHSKL